jgi:hypothetical protein
MFSIRSLRKPISFAFICAALREILIPCRFEMEFQSTLVSIVQHRIGVTTIVVHVAVSVWGSLSDIKIRTW